MTHLDTDDDAITEADTDWLLLLLRETLLDADDDAVTDPAIEGLPLGVPLIDTDGDG